MAVFKNDEYCFKVYGVEEYLDKLNEINKKLTEVKALIEEINSMSIETEFSERHKERLWQLVF